MILNTLDEVQSTIKNNIAVLLYFKTESCSVVEALEPKVDNLINSNLPEIKKFEIDLNMAPDVAAHFNAFVEPTILVFFDGKEFIRRSRTISILELENAILRPYELIFKN
jgi:thioredoxin-like negative regulator of GroEL